MVTDAQVEAAAKVLFPNAWWNRVNDVRAALAAADVGGADWQTIKTAPKDGNSILAANIGGVMEVVFWDDEAQLATHHWQTSDGPAYHNDLFTHWMPLPEPPK